MKAPEEPARCEACRRPQWRGPRMAKTDVKDVGMTLLCMDATDCRRHWPVDTPGLASSKN